MYSWVVLSQTVTASGDPKQFFNTAGEMFVEAYERVSGPSDSVLPRRIVGIGVSRHLAHVDAMESLSAYDSSYTIVPSS